MFFINLVLNYLNLKILIEKDRDVTKELR